MSTFAAAHLKLAAVARIDALRELGHATEAACLMVRVPLASYRRWKRGEGLGKRGVCVDPDKRTGRPPALELTDGEADRLHWFAVKKESTSLAIESFLAKGNPRPETADVLHRILDRAARLRKKPSWPMSVRRACLVSEEERAMFRGKKAASNIVPVGFRRMIFIDEAGAEHPIRPGDLYESDDMSLNQPFRYGAADEETLGRQVLFSQCAQSLKWLGASPCGRPKDAYRAEDIMEHMLSIVEAWGLPLWWRLERGPWENNAINGVSLDELGERFTGKRWGALSDLFLIVRAYGSRGKVIEGSFNFLQALLAHENDTVEIGRTRGEFEEATKQFLAARQLKTPELRQRALDRFWTIDEAANGILAAMENFSARPKSRREWGAEMQVPDELWMEHPGKRELDPANRWYFYPEKRFATVRHGQVQFATTYWGTKCYVVNGVADAPVSYLPHGLRVLVACDPARPELGAYIANAETGSLNRGSWTFGQCLVANAPDWALEAPAQIDLRKDPLAKRELGASKRAATAAVRTEFRATRDAGKAVEKPARKSVARDGLGNAVAFANRAGVDQANPLSERTQGRRGDLASPSPQRRNTPAEIDLEALARAEAEAAKAI